MTYFMTSKVTVNFVVSFTEFMTPKGHRLQVAVTYFMTLKFKVTFVVYLTSFMTPKGHGVIRGRRDLFYDLKRSRGHKRSP